MARHYPVRIKTSPKVGNLYWCRFVPEEVIHLPEIWKTRPVVIISRKNNLRGKVVVLPLSSAQENEQNPFSLPVSARLSALLGGRVSWVLCDHPLTVATSRLEYLERMPVRMDQEEFDRMILLFRQSIAGG